MVLMMNKVVCSCFFCRNEYCKVLSETWCCFAQCKWITYWISQSLFHTFWFWGNSHTHTSQIVITITFDPSSHYLSFPVETSWDLNELSNHHCWCAIWSLVHLLHFKEIRHTTTIITTAFDYPPTTLLDTWWHTIQSLHMVMKVTKWQALVDCGHSGGTHCRSDYHDRPSSRLASKILKLDETFFTQIKPCFILYL